MGRQRKPMTLHTKRMPKFRRFASTRYRISEEYYGSEIKMLAGTGKGNKFSGNMRRDVLCVIIKELEN